MNTFEILLAVAILLLLLIIGQLFIYGPDHNYSTKQLTAKGNIRKYFPLFIIAALLVIVLTSYFYYSYRDAKKAETYSQIRETYERNTAVLDSILEDPNLETEEAEKIIASSLDSLKMQQQKLDSLQELANTQERFTGRTATNDSIILLDKDYKRKLIKLSKDKRVKKSEDLYYKE